MCSWVVYKCILQLTGHLVASHQCDVLGVSGEAMYCWYVGYAMCWQCT